MKKLPWFPDNIIFTHGDYQFPIIAHFMHPITTMIMPQY